MKRWFFRRGESPVFLCRFDRRSDVALHTGESHMRWTMVISKHTKIIGKNGLIRGRDSPVKQRSPTNEKGEGS